MELFQLEEGAMVRSASGDALGEIERYVVNPSTSQVTHLVVKEGVVFTDLRLVPVDQIDHVGDEGPVLVEGIDPGDLAPFETEHYAPVDDVTRDQIDPGLGEASIWRYPTIATGFYPAYPGMPIPYRDESGMTTVRDVNVPLGSEIVDENAPVVSVDGEMIGALREVVIDDGGAISHLVVEMESLGSERVVPGHWIRSIDGDRIVLAVGPGSLERLEPMAR